MLYALGYGLVSTEDIERPNYAVIIKRNRQNSWRPMKGPTSVIAFPMVTLVVLSLDDTICAYHCRCDKEKVE